MAEENNDLYLPASEKYRPKEFSELVHGQQINHFLKQVSGVEISEGLPSMIIYGSDGSGKYTRLLLALKHFFHGKANPFNMKVRAVNEETGDFCVIPGSSKNTSGDKALFVLMSQCHCVLDLSQATVRKGFVSFISSFCRSKNIGINAHKYLILKHANKLEEREQCSLRRIMEKWSHNIRLLVTSNSASGWHPALKSRFFNFRLPSPTDDEAVKILNIVAKQEKWKITKPRAKMILKQSKSGYIDTIHLADMLLVAEASFLISKKSFTVYIPDRKQAVNNLFLALQNGNRERMRAIMEDVYINQIDEFISILTGDLVREIINTLNNNNKTKYNIIQLAAEWDPKIRTDTLAYPLLPAEAFYFKLAEILHR